MTRMRERCEWWGRVLWSTTLCLFLLPAAYAKAPPVDKAPTAVLKFVSVEVGVIENGVAKGAAPLVVTFSGRKSTDDVRVKHFLWHIGEGDPVKTVYPEITHTFTEVGPHDVKLVVVDNWGNESKESNVLRVQVEVFQPHIVARHISSTSESLDRVQLRVVGLPSDDAVVESFTWDFGDGTTSKPIATPETIHDYAWKGKHVTHPEKKVPVVMHGVWTTPAGKMEVELRTEIVLKGPIHVELRGYPPGNPRPATVSPLLEFPLGKPIVFDAEGSVSPYGKIVRYEFDLEGTDGDFEVDSGPKDKARVIFDWRRRPWASVRVTDEHGNQGSRLIDFGFAHLVPVIKVNPSTGPAKMSVEVDALESLDEATGAMPEEMRLEMDSSLRPKKLKKWLWLILIDKAGVYKIRLVIGDGKGAEASATATVTAGGEPKAQLMASPNHGTCSDGKPLQVKLTAERSHSEGGKIVKFEWDLDGDGRFNPKEGAGPDNSLTLEKPGLYTVRVQVTDEGGKQDVDTAWIRVEEAETAPPEPVEGGPGVVALHATLDELGLTALKKGMKIHHLDPWKTRAWITGAGLPNQVNVNLAKFRSTEKAITNISDKDFWPAQRRFHGYQAASLTHTYQGTTSRGFCVRVGPYHLTVTCWDPYQPSPEEIAEIFYRHAVAGGFMK